jgi:hypothetical protein
MKKFAFFLVFMLLMFCAAHKNAQAQGVVTGISICEYNIPSNVVNGYSETVNDYTARLYYGVYTEGYLYKNLSLLQSFASGPASVSAVVLTQDPNAVQDTQYDLFTNHYVVCIYYVESFPNYYGWDTLGYSFLSNVEIPNSYPFSANGPEAYLLNTVYEYLGSTRVTVGYFPPRLDFISPNWGYERGQVDVTLTGHNVDAGNFNTPVRVNVTGGITATVLSINPTTLTARFQVPDNLTGQQQVTITSTHGTSNPLNFFATDRQPQITGISPSTLVAGTTTSVTIDGTDFGANPDVEISGVTGVQYSITFRSDTRTTVNISVPINAPENDIIITVVSRGANGTGFLPGPPNTPPRSNPGDVGVQSQCRVTIIATTGNDINVEVSGATVFAMPGANFGLKAELSDCPTGSATYSWRMDGNAVGGSGDTLTTKLDTLGEHTVSVDLTIGSTRKSASGKIKVVLPKIPQPQGEPYEFEAAQQATRLFRPGVDCLASGNFSLSLGCRQPINPTLGIFFDAEIEVPRPCISKLAESFVKYVQIVNPYIKRTQGTASQCITGRTAADSLDKEWFIDKEANAPSNAYSERFIINLNDDRTGQFTSEDSPFYDLGKDYNYILDYQFETYIVYFSGTAQMPTNEKAIAVLRWQMKGAATYQSTGPDTFTFTAVQGSLVPSMQIEVRGSAISPDEPGTGIRTYNTKLAKAFLDEGFKTCPAQ